MKKHALFLIASILLLAGATLPLFAAGSQEGPGTESTTAAATGNEAPMLAAMVENGLIPPLADRIPAPGEVLVVQPLREPGIYGGVLERLNLAGNTSKPERDIGEGLMEFSITGDNSLVPNIAKRWEMSSDGMTWTFEIRRGIKWSDGEAFDVGDIEWVWDNVFMNSELTPTVPATYRTGADPATFTKIDDYTFSLRFTKPNPLFDRIVGAREDFTNRPGQYLSQFHPSFTDQATLDKMVSDAGFESWFQLFRDKANHLTNPDMPTIFAWQIQNSLTDPIVIYERNPYYWKVDPDGRQLPYIDRWEYIQVEDRETMQLKTIAGESDVAIHWIGFDKWSLALREAEKNDYRVIDMPFDINGARETIFFHYDYPDTEITDLFKQRDFRIAVSVAIDRDEINQIAYNGLNTTKQAVVYETHPAYDEAVAYQYTEHDPDQANRLLDSVGLNEKDSDGFRLLPSGRRMELILNTSVNNPEQGEMAMRHLQDVGIFAVTKVFEYATWAEKMRASEFPMTLGGITGGMMPIAGQWQYFPVHSAAYRWAGQYARWYVTGGQQGEEPTDPGMRRLKEIYDEASTTLNNDLRNELIGEAMKLHVDNLWRIGITQYATVPGIIKNYVHNVVDEMAYSATFPQGKYARPEQWFIRGK